MRFDYNSGFGYQQAVQKMYKLEDVSLRCDKNSIRCHFSKLNPIITVKPILKLNTTHSHQQLK